MLITTKITTDIIIALITLAIGTYFYIRHKYNYWIRRRVHQLQPSFPFGNYIKGLPRGISLGCYSYKYYTELQRGGHKYGGIYLGVDPYLVIVDTDLAKKILTSDFSHFVDRGIFKNEKSPLTVNILTQGGESWRTARAKFTSMFTAAKMKYYFDTIKKCCNELERNMEIIENRKEDFDIYEFMACYFTDVIGSVTFGVEANSFKHPDAIFRKMGRDLFATFTLPLRIELFLTICYPKLAKALSLGSFQPHIKDFFEKFVPEALDIRKESGIHRSDFLQLLIEMRDSGLLTTEEIVAESFNFFVAGFETSSGTSAFTLYELSANKNIQDRVRKEIQEVSKKFNGEFSYEALKEMTYLDQVLKETMRKYPLLATLNRVCVNDYKVPDSDLTVEKGTGIILPVLGYHRDPELFPDPETYNPDRFADPTLKYEGYFPFGDGPRNCIGARLGLLQIKLAMAKILKNYEISLSPKTKVPLEFDENAFVTKTRETVFLRVKKVAE